MPGEGREDGEGHVVELKERRVAGLHEGHEVSQMFASAHHLGPLELANPAALPSHGLSGFVIEQALEVVAGNTSCLVRVLLTNTSSTRART